MSSESHSSLMDIGRREVVELPGDASATVRCLTGALWVTEYRNGRDFVLGPGQTLTVDGRRRIVIQGLQPSTLRLYRSDAGNMDVRRIWQALARWPAYFHSLRRGSMPGQV